MADVRAAMKRSRKNRADQMEDPAILAKTEGRVTKVSPGPAPRIHSEGEDCREDGESCQDGHHGIDDADLDGRSRKGGLLVHVAPVGDHAPHAQGEEKKACPRAAAKDLPVSFENQA